MLLQPARLRLDEGQALLLVGEPLVLDGHHDLRGQHPGDLDVGRVVPAGAALVEVDGAAHSVAEDERGDQ